MKSGDILSQIDKPSENNSSIGDDAQILQDNPLEEDDILEKLGEFKSDMLPNEQILEFYQISDWEPLMHRYDQKFRGMKIFHA